MAHMVPIKDSPQLVLPERLRGVCELWYVDLITRLVGAPATLMHVFVYIYVHVRVTFGVPDFYLKQGLSHFFFLGAFLLLHVRSFSVLPSCLFRSSVSSDKRVKINRVFCVVITL